MKMKYLASCAISVVLLMSASCTTRPHAAPSAKWRAPNSSLEENLLAARELCPVGTTFGIARSRLGVDGRLANYHGQTLKATGQKGSPQFIEAPGYDEWALEYAFSDGKICLFLERPACDVHFDGSYVTSIRSMKRIHLGKTP